MDICFIASVVSLFAIMHEGCTKNCTRNIPHGEVTWWCSATAGNTCPYSCDKGYEKNPAISWMHCSSSGEWRPFNFSFYIIAEDICLPKSCPQMIPNGRLSDDCDATVGTACDYSCNWGYEKNGSTIVCETSTDWSTDPHLLCTSTWTTPAPYLCSYSIPNGHINRECGLRPFAACGYTCDDGCYKKYVALYCVSGSHWENENSACRCNDGDKTTSRSTCPQTITNGYISASCSRVPFYRCDYACYRGCRRLFASLMCTSSGSWTSGGAACICSATETTPSSQQESNTFSITMGVLVGVISVSIIICIVFYTRIKRYRYSDVKPWLEASVWNRKKRWQCFTEDLRVQKCQHRHTNSCCERAGRNDNITVAETEFRGTSNRSANPIYTLPNQTDLNTSVQLPPTTEEHSHTQQNPPNSEPIIHNNPKPPEYSTLMTQPDSRENPPPYELVMAYPADFRI